MRKDEKTPGEKTKRRHAKKGKDAKTSREKTAKLMFQMAFFRMACFPHFALKISSFRMTDFFFFVFPHGVLFCLLVFLRGIFSPKKMKRRGGIIQPPYLCV